MITVIDALKSVTNTVIRLLPIGFYMGTMMSGTIFNDFRGILLLGGFLLNEMIALGYKITMNGAKNPQCALMVSGDGTPFILPSSITQTVGFFVGFTMADMYVTDTFKPIKFIALSVLQMITVFSRINVGCESFIESLFTAILGIIIGVTYYAITRSYYKADYLLTGTTADATAQTNIDNFFKA